MSLFMFVVVMLFIFIITVGLVYKFFLEAYLKRKKAMQVLKSIQKVFRG